MESIDNCHMKRQYSSLGELEMATVSHNELSKDVVLVVGRSTNMIHWTFDGSGGAVRCNARNTGVSHTTATLKHVESAPSGMFCKKCFKNGKPQHFFENNK